MKVLIADDELVYLKIVKKMIRGWGFEVVQVTDGNQAWEILEHDSSIHIALLDWMMPGVDGLELTRRIRKREGMPYIAVLVLSARDSQADIDAGYAAGVDDYLIKPLHAAQLRQRLAVAERVVTMEREMRNSQHVLSRLVSSLGRSPESSAFPEKAPFDIAQCIQMAIASSKYAIRPYAKLHASELQGLPKVMGNPDRLEELLVQMILDSAARIREKGSGEIFLSCLADEGQVNIYLEDDAPRLDTLAAQESFLKGIQVKLELMEGKIRIEPGTRGGVRYRIRLQSA